MTTVFPDFKGVTVSFTPWQMGAVFYHPLKGGRFKLPPLSFQNRKFKFPRTPKLRDSPGRY